MKVLLGDIADIRSGATLRGRDASRPVPEGRYRLVRISDLSPEGHLDLNSCIRINPPEEINPEFKLCSGDVIFACRGVRTQAAHFSDPYVQDAIPGAQFFLLRGFGEQVSPDYLTWVINSPESQTYFAANGSGSHVPLITSDVLKKLPISIPNRKKQDLVVAIDKLSEEEQMLMAKIAHLRKQLLDHQLQQASTSS